jgi:signal transduction histidine kinase
MARVAGSTGPGAPSRPGATGTSRFGRMTLKQRVTWALTGAVALFVALQAALVYLVLDEQEDALVDQIVTTEATRLVQRLALGEVVPPESGPLELGPSLKAWVAPPGGAHDEIPASIQALAPGAYQVNPDESVWHVIVTDSPSGRVFVRYDATDNEERVYEFGAILLGLWLACSLAGFWLSRSAAGLILRPMMEVTDRVSGWAPGAPAIKVDRDDEAGRLIEAFSRVQDRVEQSIAQEREFSANLSHEVRTPLTSIRTDAEMAALDAAVSPPLRDRLTRIMQNVDEIGSTLETARAISSAQAGPRTPVVLAECLDDAWSGLSERGQRAGLVLVNELPPTAVAELDRYGLLIVLRNLIRNAIDHAAPATLRVTARGSGLVVTDDGPGIAAPDLPFVFERYYRGRWKDRMEAGPPDEAGRERGLGLAIAKRVCDTQGWKLTVTSSTDSDSHHTAFFLQFA